MPQVRSAATLPGRWAIKREPVYSKQILKKYYLQSFLGAPYFTPFFQSHIWALVLEGNF